ncbi:hypothetical protein MXD81_12485, partial [Microbacteriaceae bacterium K1510]|nr:hypothetical protein [Microbacteriaceae bacterium K1510]
LTMNKRWRYGVIAGVALFSTACATSRNAAPSPGAPGTTVQNQAGTYPRALNNYDRAGTYGTNRPGYATNPGQYGTNRVDGFADRTAGRPGDGSMPSGYGPNRVGSNNYGVDGRGFYGTVNPHATYRGTGLGGLPNTGLHTGYNATTGMSYNPVDGTVGSIYRDRHMSTT